MCERTLTQLPPARAPLGTGPTTQACAQTGDGNSNPSLRLPALNPLSHTGQGLSIFKDPPDSLLSVSQIKF